MWEFWFVFVSIPLGLAQYSTPIFRLQEAKSSNFALPVEAVYRH